MARKTEGMNVLKEQIARFKVSISNLLEGQQILEHHELEPAEVREVFDEIQAKYAAGKDITVEVLRRLLPHFDSRFHGENGYRIST